MSTQTEEQSSKFFIFGNGAKGDKGGGREIFPKGYPKKQGKATVSDDVGTFMMVNGENSKPARYLEGKRTWIPIDVSDPSKFRNINKEPTYNQILIMFAEIHYGGKWNPETHQIEVTPETRKYQQPERLGFSQYLSKFEGMEETQNYIDKHPDKARIDIDPKTQLATKFGVAGFGREMYDRYKRVVLAYENPNKDSKYKKIVGKGLSKEELEELRKKAKRTFEAQEVVSMSAQAKWKENFYAQPYIQKWFEKMKATKETASSPRSYIARVFLLTNYLNPKRFMDLTVGSYNLPEDVRVDKLKRIVAIWKHWNLHFETDEEFYKTGWIDKKYSETEELHFPENIWKGLEGFNEREKKTGLKRKYDGKKKAEGARKTASDALVAFVMYAPTIDGVSGKWKPDDQPPKTMLSRKVKDPAYKEHGQKIDDADVVKALKFLETGKVHHWEQKKVNGKKVFRQLEKMNVKTQEIEDEFEPVRELIPNETQKQHYNPALNEYQVFGSPYGKTKPASMLFRLSILCGWRKTEALTTPTRSITDVSLTEYADFEDDHKPSGLTIDRKTGLLQIHFLTRKTKKRGAEGAYFTAVIPPFSTKVMDSRDTIAMVCEKAGLGRWVNTDYYNYKDVKHEDKETKKITTYYVETPNDKWFPQIVPFTSEEKEKMFPPVNDLTGKRLTTVKTRTETIKNKLGIPSEWLIGENGQFYRQTATAPSGNEIPTYDLPDGTGKFGLDVKSEEPMVRAYLNFPLMECYAVMDGSTVDTLTDSAVEDQAKEDFAYYEDHPSDTAGKDFKVFQMVKGWSQVCDLGCGTDKGQKATKSYSRFQMNQDNEKYITEDQDYWLEHSIHSLRHLFAQLWLRKSKWNFGVVASRGHWETLDTLKKHYGGIDKTTLGDQMTEVFSSDQDGENKMDQAIDRSIAMRNAQYSQEVAKVQTKQEPTPEGVTSQKEEKEDEEILKKKLEEKVEDV